MNTNFDLLTDLPLLIFAIFFVVVFALFVLGGVLLLIAKGDAVRVQKGRKVLFTALICLFIVLLIMLVFYLVTYLVRRGESLVPKFVSGEFPISPAINFPPPNNFMNLGGYYFNGPFSLKKVRAIEEKACVYAVLCKNGEKYDIIYVDVSEQYNRLLKNQNYGCWVEKCNRNPNDLSLAILWTSPIIYDSIKRNTIKDSLQKEFNPPCPL